MQRHDAAFARPAVTQLGLATRKELRREGLSDREIDRRMASGAATAVHRGVLLNAAVAFEHETRQLAAVLACGSSAVLSHRSAAAVHRLEGIRRLRPELTVLGTRLPRLRGATIHRTDCLMPADVCRVGHLPVTSVARTLLDLGAVVPFEVVERAMQVAVIERKVSHADLISVLDRVGKRGRRGTAPLRAALTQSLPSDGLASVLEHDLLALVRRATSVEPMLQHRLVCSDGRIVVLDIAWPRWRHVVEADGHRWHATRAQLESDNARRRSIRASGWTLDAFGWGDVHDRRHQTLTDLTRSLSLFPPGG